MLADRQPAVHLGVFGDVRNALGAIRKDGKYDALRALRFDEARGLVWVVLSSDASKGVEDRLGFDPNHSWRLVERRFETLSLAGTVIWTYGTTVGGVEFPSGFTATVQKVNGYVFIASTHPCCVVLNLLWDDAGSRQSASLLEVIEDFGIAHSGDLVEVEATDAYDGDSFWVH